MPRHGTFGPYNPPRFDERVERLETAESEADWLIRKARAAIEQRKLDALASIAEGSGPYSIRLRAAIRRDADLQNKLARVLWDQTVSELVRAGEMSEATDKVWTILISPERAAQLWPVEQMQEAAE